MSLADGGGTSPLMKAKRGTLNLGISVDLT